MNPNELVAPAVDTWVWLAPDWSDYRPGDKAPPGTTGWTRVKIRESRYNDGRIVRHVLDATGNPVDVQGQPAASPDAARPLDSTPQYDKEQQNRFEKGQATAARGDQEGDIRPSNGPTREVYRGGKWVVEPNPVYQPPATAATAKPAGSTTQIEGTPLPGGGFDNTKPIMVTRKPDGSLFSSEPLTAAERQQWEREKNGGKTDADLATPPKEEVNPSDPTRLRKPDGKGGWEDAGPNAAGVQAAADRNKPGAPTIKPDGKGGSVAVQTMPDGSIKTTPLPDVPSDKPAPDRVTVNGTVFERGADGVYAPAAGLPTEGAIAAPPGMPELDTSSAEAAHASYLKQYQWAQAQIATGKLSPERAAALLKPSESATASLVSKAKEERDRQQQAVTNALSQRTQDITQSGNRLTNSTSQFGTALESAEKTNLLADPGTGAAANSLLGTLALQKLYAGSMGGLADTPPVVIPGPVANLPVYPGAPPAAVTTPPGAPTGADVAGQAAASQQQSQAPNGAALRPPPVVPGSPRVVAPSAVRPPVDTNPRGVDATTDPLTNQGMPAPFMPAPPVSVQARDTWAQPTAPMAPPPMAAPYQDSQDGPAAIPGGGAGGNVQMAPGFGMPTMALAASLGGGDPYADAKRSLKARGFSDQAIEEALQSFVSGAAA